MHNKILGITGYILLISLLGGCEQRIRVHGNYLKKEQIQKVVVQKDNKKSVLEKLGPPSFNCSYLPDVWIYGGSRIKENIAYNQILDSHFVVIYFDSAHNVTRVKVIDAKDNAQINAIASKTPVKGKAPTFIELIAPDYYKVFNLKKQN